MTKMDLFSSLGETKVFRDPIHGYIHVDNALIYALICTPTFQRLRRIKQLGATYIVYSSAEHSRFSHSLGVYEIARRSVTENEYVANALSKEEKIYVQIAALLHDIGHGPFSHVFESLIETSHEEITKKLLVEPSDIHDLLESVQKGLGNTIASLISHRYPKPVCWQLVSSQLDCDRMDYLLRDAYFTGTKYGEFDLERILRTIRVVNDQLVVKQSGIYAVENYLMARFHMFWQVYYHINIRIFESMLVAWNKRMMQIESSNPLVVDYQKMINHIDDLTLYCASDDATMITLFKLLSHHDDPILSDLSSRLLNRHLFHEYLFNEDQLIQWSNHLKSLGYDPDYYLLMDTQMTTATRPYNSKGKQKINILTEDGDIKEITEVSNTMKALASSTTKDRSYCFMPIIDQ